MLLEKGESVKLSDQVPNIENIMIGIGWESKEGVHLDVNTSVFMLSEAKKILSDEYFVFYNNLKSPDGSVRHGGDCLKKWGNGDDEMIFINLGQVISDIQEIDIILSLHEAFQRHQNFGMLKNLYLRIVDLSTEKELLRYDLRGAGERDVDVEFGKFLRQESSWIFQASGQSSRIGLEGYVNQYVDDSGF